MPNDVGARCRRLEARRWRVRSSRRAGRARHAAALEAIDTSESKKTPPQVLLPTRRRLATRRDFAERGVSRAEWLRIARTRSRPR